MRSGPGIASRRGLHRALLVAALIVPLACTAGTASARPLIASAAAIPHVRTEVRLAGETLPRAVLDRLRPVRASTGQLRAPVTVTVLLRRTRQQAFERFLAAVTNRRSAQFRHFLSQRQLTARFGPSAQRYRSVMAWLRSRGLRVLAGSADRLTVTVRGSRALVDRAFKVGIGEYLLRGRATYSVDQAPAVPVRLAGAIQSVVGLSGTASPSLVAPTWKNIPKNCAGAKQKPGAIAKCFGTVLQNPDPKSLANSCWAIVLEPTLFAEVGATFQCWQDEMNLVCSAAMNALLNSSFKWCVPPQLTQMRRRNARVAQIAPSQPLPGAGEKIGLLELDNYAGSDVSDFLAYAGYPSSLLSHVSETNVDGGAAVSSGESEVLLDIDAALATAPGASIDVFDAPIGPTDFVDEFNAMINAGVNVISNSWNSCEDLVSQSDAQAIDTVLQQAAASGISVLSSSGDDGSTCADGSANTAAVPSDSPHLTAVGGTAVTPGPGGTYGSETYWDGAGENPPTGSGGFGVSKYFAQPAYQAGKGASSGRSIPDIAANADPYTVAYQICQADAGGCPTGSLFGGTSLAAPLVAASIAVVDQQLGKQLGELNPLLYPLGGTSAFHSAASLGSDFAHVGLGSPNFDQLALAVAGAHPGPVDPSASFLAAEPVPDIPADGSTPDTLVVRLVDSAGNEVPGQSVQLVAGPHTGNLKITAPAGQTTSVNNGTVAFEVTDTVAETVSFSAENAAGTVTYGDPAQVAFVAPAATGAVISASPTTVKNDGSSQATISVYLQNALDQPAVGDQVLLYNGGSHASVSPASGTTGYAEATTDATGVAHFTATDSTQESVAFTACQVTSTDTTCPQSGSSSSNLAVPGDATVTFEASGSSSSCKDTVPTPVSGYTISTWASGIPYNPQALVNGPFTLVACSGAGAAQFDPSGNIYVPDTVSGEIYRLGPSGGSAGSANALPNSPFAAQDALAGLTFGPSGALYATQVGPELDQIDPLTGQLQRVVANSSSGAQMCGFSAATDPLSADVFEINDCTGLFIDTGNIQRIAGTTGTSPSGSSYSNANGTGQLTFAPDGMMYASSSNGGVYEISGTNGPSPPTITTLATLPDAANGVGIGQTDAQGHATVLYVTDANGNIYRLGVAHTPASVTKIASGGASLGGVAMGPDGCPYIADLDLILKLSGPGCSASNAGPEISLVPDGSVTPATGSSASVTATLSNFPAPAGTPVHFLVFGPNPQAGVVDAGAGDGATFSYTGVFEGTDVVSAWADVNGKQITAAPVQLHWSAGKDTSFLTLNQSQESGLSGQPTTLVANLIDEAADPATPISGASVTLSLAGQSCHATTDASGAASCSVTPAGATGLRSIAASYAGDSTHTPASASSAFALGGLLPPGGGSSGGGGGAGGGSGGGNAGNGGSSPAAPVNISAPQISGTPEPGDRLACSTGSWSGTPTAFGYAWSRNGSPISGATGSSYTVQIADEAQTLTCTVSATNAAGSAAKTSSGIVVSIPGTLSCPQPSGSIHAATLGPLTLGLTRTAARKRLHRFAVTANNFDNFCLFAGWGIRVGYPSAHLLAQLPGAQRGKLASRVVLALTANPFYALDGARPGFTLASVAKRLHVGQPIQIGVNSWYVAPGAAAMGVLKVRGGVIQEVGIADRRLTLTRRQQQAFLASFKGAAP